MGIYLEFSSTTGKVIIIDEAHKICFSVCLSLLFNSRAFTTRSQYITDTPASKTLTKSLLIMIRQQRHYDTWIIISIQKPTIFPRLIDLCSVIIIHFFFNPKWFSVLCRHVFILNEQGSNNCGTVEFFKRIPNLRTSEALIFAPSEVMRKEKSGKWRKMTEKLLKMRMRKKAI